MEQRTLVVHGLPICTKHAAYARPLVMRLDRDASIFEEPYSTKAMVSGETAPDAAMKISRQRMRVTLRAGLCTATSLGTWDCAAPSWLAATTLSLDDSSEPFDATLPPFEVTCGSAPATGTAKAVK